MSDLSRERPPELEGLIGARSATADYIVWLEAKADAAEGLAEALRRVTLTGRIYLRSPNGPGSASQFGTALDLAEAALARARAQEAK